MAKKIVVVDDDRDIRLLLQVILRKEGYDVCAAQDGYEGLELIDAVEPDLVVIDAMMPVFDGFATLKSLRTQPSTATLPVVMLSAQTEDDNVLRAWRDGVDLYLEKPFDPQDLTAYIRRIFQERRKAADRRAAEARTERRIAVRRDTGESVANFHGHDIRASERRTGDRRTGDRRLEFAASELVEPDMERG